MKEEIYPGIYYEGSSVSFDLSIYFSYPDAIPAKVFIESLNGMSMMLEESRHARVQRDFYAAPMRWWSISCCAVDLSEVFDAVLEELFESV